MILVRGNSYLCVLQPLGEKSDLVSRVGIGFHFVLNDLCGMEYGGVASVYGFGDFFQGLIGMATAQICIDVARVGMNPLSGFRVQHLGIHFIVLTDKLMDVL